jgi:hypothetical protein
MEPGEHMTRDEWSKLSDNEKAKLWPTYNTEQRKHLADLSGLTPQLNGLEHQRVEAVRKTGEVVRFYVGRSAGWRPCHIEIMRMSSTTSDQPADPEYKSIAVLPGKWRV